MELVVHALLSYYIGISQFTELLKSFGLVAACGHKNERLDDPTYLSTKFKEITPSCIWVNMVCG
jgi:hypothetical protein